MKKENINNPVPVRLGDKKAFLQKEAAENDRSLHYWINKILTEYIKSKTEIKPLSLSGK